MSKLNDHFDQIELSDELKQQTLNRIKQEKVTKTICSTAHTPWFKKPAVWARVLSCFLIIALILPIVLTLYNPAGPYDTSHTPTPNPNPPGLPPVRPPIAGANYAFTIQNEDHLNELFNISDSDPRQNWGGDVDDGDGNGGWMPDGDSPGDSDDGGRNNGATSETNIQVDGMDEGDIVRNDGRFIYRLSPQGLTIVETVGGQINYIRTLRYANFAPVEMFVRDNRMIILGGTRQENPYWLLDSMTHREWQWFSRWHDRVQIRVYDISDRSNPILERFFEIDGQFNTSRVQMDTNTLFFVVDFWPTAWHWCSETYKHYRSVRLPYYRNCESEELKPFPIDNLFYTVKNVRKHSFMLLGRIDLDELYEPALVKGYLASNNIISISRYNLFSAATVWIFEYEQCQICEDCDPSWLKNMWCWCDWCIVHIKPDGCEATGQWVDRTHISRFCLETLYFHGTALVLGTPPSRHAIDEHNGYLRVATTYGAWWMNGWWNDHEVYFASAVFVFDSDLELVSYIRNIAEGETMDSARFNGDFGFISTSPPWLIWDPLYTVDLRNHYDIQISKGLETDGINQYLRHIPGTGLAIGIGQDAPPEGSALQIGIKIELYDMRIGTGKAPVSLSKYTIYGEGTWADVLREPRALLFMFCEYSLTGYIGFSAGVDWGKAQGFYLWAIDASDGDENARLEFLGETRQVSMHSWEFGTRYVDLLLPSFTNFDVNNYIWNQNSLNWCDWIYTMRKFIYRAVVNNGYLFTVSDSVIAGYCMITRDRVSYFIG